MLHILTYNPHCNALCPILASYKECTICALNKSIHTINGIAIMVIMYSIIVKKVF